MKKQNSFIKKRNINYKTNSDLYLINNKFNLDDINKTIYYSPDLFSNENKENFDNNYLNTENPLNQTSISEPKKIYVKKSIIKNKINKIPKSNKESNIKIQLNKINSQRNYNINNNNQKITNNLNRLMKSSSSSNLTNYLKKYNNNNQINLNNFTNNNNNEKTFINIEDLLLLEEKFNDIKFTLNNPNSMNLYNECFEFLNFYNNSSLYNKFENYFIETNNKLIIHETIILIIYNIILIYHIYFCKNSFLIKCKEIIENVLDLNHKNYLILCEYILSKISQTEKNNLWVKKLKIMLINNLNHIDFNNKDFIQFAISNNNNLNININNSITNIFTEIKYYKNCISKFLRLILRNLSNDNLNKDFVKYFKNLKNLDSIELNNFFQQKVLKIINKNASIIGKISNPFEFNNINNNNYNIINLPMNNKNFTLILDLDETLISFKTDPFDESKGLLRFRPYLYEFLDLMKKYFEIIIFTSATIEYADPILNAIENGKKKYFDFRLYRNHTIIVNNNEFVKDISRIGRNLEKCVIVDNMPQNFRLQKENGIFIKAFWGEDIYDTALLNLSEILEKIVNEYDDLRKGIFYYKDEILNKVSSNFSRNE